ncbi:MAG: hypothetical protein K2N90_12935 [Lachnospiraceae bacterium]|nr:hypothetical protein [Lachnospiraceae bacterium]
MSMEGYVFIEGKTVEIRAEKNLSLGEPTQEGGSPVANAELEAGSLTMQVGEDGAQIRLTQEAEIIATFIRMEAAELNLSGAQSPNSPEEFYKNVTQNDRWVRMTINTNAENTLVQNYDDGREKALKGATKIAGTVIVVGVIVGLTLAA